MGSKGVSEEGEGVTKILFLVLRGAKEENDNIFLLALEEVDLLEALCVSKCLDEVDLNRGYSLEVMFSFKDKGLKAH